MKRHGLSLRALNMSMTHTPERRRIPHLDDRWSIDQSGQVYGPSGKLDPLNRIEAAQRARKRLANVGPLHRDESIVELHIGPEGEHWTASSEAVVEWCWWSPNDPSSVKATGHPIKAVGDTRIMWFAPHSHQGTDAHTAHLFHGPSVAAIVFQSA